eukprot:SAG25_NODE_11701_length_298_cov_0.708543_1_plen_36_part_10
MSGSIVDLMYDRRLSTDIFFYRAKLGPGRMHPSVHV